MKKKWWIGSTKSNHMYVPFKLSETPTENVFGKLFGYVIGPFRDMKGAYVMTAFGKGNPHMQTVSEVYRVLKYNPELYNEAKVEIKKNGLVQKV